MKKEVLLYAKFINYRYDYIQMMHNGLTKAIKDRDIDMCKLYNEEIKKDIEIIRWLKLLIDKK